MIDLKAKPFNLDEEGVKWVEDTLDSMTTEEKIGQVFCPIGTNSQEEYLRYLVCGIKVGGMMYRPDAKERIYDAHRRIQEMAKIPLLLAANVESGGDGILAEGTTFGKPMAVAATGNSINAYRMGYVACREGAAVGMNWAFAPIVDIDTAFRSPITNVRTFGSNADTVIEYASEYLRAADENKVAVSIKHFPGDGVDERDQHLVTSINSLSADKWRETYGRVYKTLIDRGAKTVMVGHIALPEMVREYRPEATTLELLMPASLSGTVLTDVLRGELGFNGLISTDSTTMLGYTTAMKRSKAIPLSIASGCDVILFNKNLQEDYEYLCAGVKEGIVTMERLNEAVTRILATKASLGLHKKQQDKTLVPEKSALDTVGNETFRAWAKDCADQSITLVHDTQKLLPLSPKKTKRVYMNVISHSTDIKDPVAQKMKRLFEEEGFEVTLRNRSIRVSVADLVGDYKNEEVIPYVKEIQESIKDFTDKYDLYVYIANVETASNNTVIRLDWNVVFGLGNDAPWFTEEIPTLFISTANPYHFYDVPMVKTFINAYSNNEFSCEALMDKLMGRSEFKGKSPVDPYCGLMH